MAELIYELSFKGAASDTLAGEIHVPLGMLVTHGLTSYGDREPWNQWS